MLLLLNVVCGVRVLSADAAARCEVVTVSDDQLAAGVRALFAMGLVGGGHH